MRVVFFETLNCETERIRLFLYIKYCWKIKQMKRHPKIKECLFAWKITKKCTTTIKISKQTYLLRKSCKKICVLYISEIMANVLQKDERRI